MKPKNKVSAREIKSVFLEVLLNGYHHIAAINKELHELKIEDPNNATPEQQQKLRALTLTLTLINDLIHPAHKISKNMLKESQLPLVDYCMNMQKVALETKLVDECFCSSCSQDKKTVNS
jgi:hypothetical protein